MTSTAPRWLKPMNKVLMLLSRLGIGLRELPVLTLPGRRTGKLRSTPLSVLELDGARYLLEGYPGADWAANARAVGTGSLRIGKRNERIRLVELAAADARPVLREWPVRLESGAKMMKDAGVVVDTTPDAFETLAGRCAVFRIESAGST